MTHTQEQKKRYADAKNKKAKENYLPKKNTYETKIGAINYLVKNTVYSNEWTGAGMYEVIVKIVEAPKKLRFRKEYLNGLLEEASNR